VPSTLCLWLTWAGWKRWETLVKIVLSEQTGIARRGLDAGLHIVYRPRHLVSVALLGVGLGGAKAIEDCRFNEGSSAEVSKKPVLGHLLVSGECHKRHRRIRIPRLCLFGTFFFSPQRLSK
jgi:hypothetical protein